MSRPRLKSHARLLRRGPGTVQLGLASDAGVVLDGLTPAEIDLLGQLDGRAGLDSLYAAAGSAGVPRERVDTLLGALRGRHLLVEHPTDRACLGLLTPGRRDDLTPDADALAAVYRDGGDGFDHVVARQRQRVVVGGEGGLAGAVAVLLRCGGVGRVDVGVEALDATDLDLRLRPPVTKGPDLVVLVGAGAIDPDAGAGWQRRGIPHLPLVWQGHRITVGPLVRPGAGPCLRCLDLHRSDRDAAWPALLAQLAPHRAVGRAAAVSAATPLTAIAAGITATIVHTYLDTGTVPEGLSLEVSMPWPRVAHRRWQPHPRCGCAGSAGAEAGTPAHG